MSRSKPVGRMAVAVAVTLIVALAAPQGSGGSVVALGSGQALAADPMSRLYLFSTLRGGVSDAELAWGSPGVTVLACDMDGDGLDEPVQHYRYQRTFTWATSTAEGAPQGVFVFGSVGDDPVCGDWDGDGVETIGLHRGRTFFLRNSNSAGPVDVAFSFGRPGDVPVVGSWDGGSVDHVGVVRGRTWHLTDAHAGGAASETFVYGRPGDEPLVGDWDGDGTDGPGVRRSFSRHTMLRNALSSGVADITILVGATTDVAVAADWGLDGGPTEDAVSLWREFP